MRRSFWAKGALAVLVGGAADGREKKRKTTPAEQPKTGSCVASSAAAIWWSPRDPLPGAPLRILAVSESAREGTLQVKGPDGAAASRAVTLRGGPPFSLSAEIEKAAAGAYEVSWTSGGKTIARQTLALARAPPEPAAATKFVWAAQRQWDRTTEDLYSAWIEPLFDAPPDKSIDHPALPQVLRRAGPNFLFAYLGP